MALLTRSDLDRRITFQRRAPAAGFIKTAQGTWVPVATVWAQVRDLLPSRSEKLADGIILARRPARIRIRFRSDITSDMQILYAGRTLQIMGPPVELGRREGLEMMAQDFSTEGSAS